MTDENYRFGSLSDSSRKLFNSCDQAWQTEFRISEVVAIARANLRSAQEAPAARRMIECSALGPFTLTSWRYLHQPEKLLPRTIRKLQIARELMVYEGLR